MNCYYIDMIINVTVYKVICRRKLLNLNLSVS